MTSATSDPVWQTENQLLAEQIYDYLMAGIEPELMLENIPKLDFQYKNETSDDHEIRMKRYEVAYRKFDEAMRIFKTEVDSHVRAGKHDALTAEESKVRGEESGVLEQLDADFSGAK